MRLTTTIRDAFVIAAMQDLPAEDFHEQKQKLLQAEAREKLPPKVRAIYDDKELRSYLSSRYINGCYIYAPSDFTPSGALLKKLAELDDKHNKQRQQHLNLRSKLKAVARSCSTRKALAETLPEFAKYLPAEGAPVDRTVPVVANVVADFVKAGWPKGKQQTKKEVA